MNETTKNVDQDESVRFWERKQRELVTGTVDYNLDSLSHLVDEGTIDLAPQYQRRDRWDRKRQSELIESFLMNVPIRFCQNSGHDLISSRVE